MKNSMTSYKRPNLLRMHSMPRFLNIFNEEFDDLFKDFLPTVDARGDGNWFSPAADLHETSKEFIFSFDVPGVKEKDISLELSGHTLKVSGERKSEKTEDFDPSSEVRHRSEKAYGFFERKFELPENVDTEKIEASFTDGVLEIRIPKLEAAQSKVISIKTQDDKNKRSS